MPKQEAPKRDLLEGHPRYKKLTDLNEGTFGVVMLALDQATNERVRSKHPDHLPSGWQGAMNVTVHAQVTRSPALVPVSSNLLCFAQVAIKFLERGAGIGRGVLREVLNHR